jgi:mRNA-degrading endonuclease YafQ of YafQ-DinJ toxin-antitoxin module
MKKSLKPPNIEFTSLFNRKRKALPLSVKTAFRETLEIFLENPTDVTLRRHFLKGKYAEYQSIDVTPDYRAIFKEIKKDKGTIIKFYTIGTHEELYGK